MNAEVAWDEAHRIWQLSLGGRRVLSLHDSTARSLRDALFDALPDEARTDSVSEGHASALLWLEERERAAAGALEDDERLPTKSDYEGIDQL